MKRLQALLFLFVAVVLSVGAQNVARDRSLKIYRVDPETFSRYNPSVNIANLDSCIAHSDSTAYAGCRVVSFSNRREREAFMTSMMSQNSDGRTYSFTGNIIPGDNCVAEGFIDNGGEARIQLPDNGEVYILSPDDDYLNVDLNHIWYEQITINRAINIPILIVTSIRNMGEAGKTEAMNFKRKNPNYRSPGMIRINSKVPIDSSLTDANLRIAVRPYAVEYESDEIKKILAPRVINGVVMEDLLMRDLGQNIDHYDRLRPYTIQGRYMRTGTNDTILIVDSIKNIVDSLHYPVYAYLHVLNRDQIISTQEIEIDDGRNRDPLRFVSVEFADAQLDYLRYQKYGRLESMADSKTTNLFFKQGRHTLDADDHVGHRALQDAIDFAEQLTRNNIYFGQRFEITGYASPEGDYRANMALAQRRAEYLRSQLQNSAARNATFILKDPLVQPWTTVADTLEVLGYRGEAEEVRGICSRNSEMNEQYRVISQLPYYRQLILDVVLPKLRIDKIAATWNVNRIKDLSEILADYRRDPSTFLRGQGRMPYEYYELIQYFADSIDIVGPLARVAYEKYPDVSGFSDGFRVTPSDPDRPWSVAAYHYARYLRHTGVLNDTLLVPYLRYGAQPNYPQAWDPHVDPRNQYLGSRYNGAATFNDEAITMTQLSILFDEHKYREADSLYVNCMNTDRFATVRYFIDCFSDASRVGDPVIRDAIANTSEWNRFMIYAAQDKDVNPAGWYHYNRMALNMLNDTTLREVLRMDDPRVLYTIAIVKYRMNVSETDRAFSTFFNASRRAYEDPRQRRRGRDIGTDEMWRALMLDESILERWLRWDGYFHLKYYEAARDALRSWHEAQEEAQQQEAASEE